MAKQMTNVSTYIGILFLFVVLVGGLTLLATETRLNDNSNLDNDSIEYIAALEGIDISEYQRTQSQQENSILITGNESAGNPKDDSLSFLFQKEKGFNIELTIKRIFGMPSFILVDLLRLPLNQWNWIINIIGWVLGLMITIAIIYLVTGRIDR